MFDALIEFVDLAAFVVSGEPKNDVYMFSDVRHAFFV